MKIKVYIANLMFKFVMKNTTYHGQMTKDMILAMTKISHIDDEEIKSDKIIYIRKQCQEFLAKYNLLDLCNKKYRSGLIPNPETEIQEMRNQEWHHQV